MTHPTTGGSYRLDPATGELVLVEPPTEERPRRSLPAAAPENPLRSAKVAASDEVTS